jgi:hypothetical protein
MPWNGLLSMPHCQQCDHGHEEGEHCIIDRDLFADDNVDLETWVISTGNWGIVDGRLRIAGAGRITMLATPTGGAAASVKIVTEIRCLADGVAYVTIAEDADGNRLGVKFTQSGDCLDMLLGSMDNGGTSEEYTQSVACFVSTSQEAVAVDLCWVQGADIPVVEN